MKDDKETRGTKWLLDRGEPDIRGWPVVDENGKRVGNVGNLLVDAETSYVSEITLNDGTRIAAHDLELADRRLIYRTPAQQRAAPDLRVVEGADGRKARVEETATTKAREVKETVAATKPAATTAKQAVTTPTTPAIPAMPATTRATEQRVATRAGEDIIVPLVEEELEVGKRRYDTGGVHLETHVVREPVTKEVRVAEEHVTVQRGRVDRPLSSADAERAFHDETYEVRTQAEVPTLCKQAHVVEEIIVKKTVVDREATVRDTLRHTEADITELRAEEAQQGARR